MYRRRIAIMLATNLSITELSTAKLKHFVFQSHTKIIKSANISTVFGYRQCRYPPFDNCFRGPREVPYIEGDKKKQKKERKKEKLGKITNQHNILHKNQARYYRASRLHIPLIRN